MDKKQINIRDFGLFCELVKSAVKIVDSAKLQIDENGLAIYGARKPIARCELTTNAVYANERVEASVLDLQMLSKVLQTAKDVHGDDWSSLSFTMAGDKLCFESKKFKTKFQTQKESIIAPWISQAITAKMSPKLEFITTNDFIRRVRNHQFIFTDPTAMRIHLGTSDSMEKNSIFATLSSKQTTLSNEMTLKFGLVTFGSLDGKQAILDMDRLNLFDAVQAKEIKVSFMDANVAVSDVKLSGKDDTYFSAKVYCSLLKP